MTKFPPRTATSKLLVLTLAALVALAGTRAEAGWFRKEPPVPGKTTLESPMVNLPAQLAGDYLLVSAKWDRKGPYTFLIDTGSSATLISPSLAQRYGTVLKNVDGTRAQVAAKAADGDTVMLDSINLKRFSLGEVRFENVQALVYDCTGISVNLGIRVDGILGFPLFREVLLTLDYPHRKVVLATAKGAAALEPGTVVPFSADQRTPIITLQVNNQNFFALIDSGSDSTLRLNPVGLTLHYAQEPRPGAIVSTLSGDHRQSVARLGDEVLLGDHKLSKPVVEITDELSAIGGAVLRNFTVTFDQEKKHVIFYRDSQRPLTFAPKKSPGLSVTKAGAYWRIIGVIPDSPAARAGIEEGDLITRINQEPVEQWGSERFNRLVEESDSITFAFLVGKREYEMKLGVMELIP